MSDPVCPHDTLQFSAEAKQLFASETQSFTAAFVYVRCSTCLKQFHWHGLASGVPNKDEPVVSADGYQLRCPIVAGPGAVVGLLEKTGTLDKLVEPTNA